MILGPDEINNGQVAVKDLSSREQISLPRDGLAQALLKLLDNDPAA